MGLLEKNSGKSFCGNVWPDRIVQGSFFGAACIEPVVLGHVNQRIETAFKQYHDILDQEFQGMQEHFNHLKDRQEIDAKAMLEKKYNFSSRKCGVLLRKLFLDARVCQKV